jgi:hypothetical protein
MNNPEKLATYDTQHDDKQNKKQLDIGILQLKDIGILQLKDFGIL